MTAIGLALSSEQHGPDELVSLARDAEAAGFDFLALSDHYHPWLARQGNSPFAWGVLGAIAEATDHVEVGTGVTCPTMRVHPAVVAQAAATAAVQLEDRFFLGLGTGERLNEHVTGKRWPPYERRLSMLAEAIHVIRSLWDGEETTHHGEHYTVENARLYTTPDSPPPIHVAAGGEDSGAFAGRNADGLIATSPDADVVEAFRAEGAEDRPRYGQATVCVAEDEETAADLAHEHWANGALPGKLGQELATPEQFADATQLVSPADVADGMTVSQDPSAHVEAIRTYEEAGFDHVFVHQVNPDAEGFFDLYGDEVLPAVR